MGRTEHLGSGGALGKPEIVFHPQHSALLQIPDRQKYREQRSSDFTSHKNMKSHVQILTTPTADTPGTTLLLHFDNKRYLIGNLAEGTQRACIQMGARLLKVSECFITGRTEWANTGGLIGMILTLADSLTASAAASQEEAKKRAHAKARRRGYSENAEMVKQTEGAKKQSSTRLTLFSAPNLNHTLATARRFVFRKGMPVDVHEIGESLSKQEGEDEDAPYWADENIKVWPISVLPSSSSESGTGSNTGSGTISPRKRSFDEMHGQEASASNGTTSHGVVASDLTPKQRDLLTVKAVVSEMFDSTWRLDTLQETPLSQVNLPASIFIRDADTNKIVKYTGPLPGGNNPVPDPNLTVLVRKPWPGALVESLPPTKPAKEAVSYIIRNHRQRGKFHPERAASLKVHKGLMWAHLAAGQNVENADGEIITPDMVLGESREGGGFAVVDLPGLDYIDNLLARREWREPKLMVGVGAIIWICGLNVSGDARVHRFMREFGHLEHIVSSSECCPNRIALDSAAASTVRLRQVDPKRYSVPHHTTSTVANVALPANVHVAQRGQSVQLEPSIAVQSEQIVPPLSVAETEAEMAPEVLEEAARAQESVAAAHQETEQWKDSLPANAQDAEIVTLGTGSALPSKYRNVSATLLRVPGWGSMLFDCGENTLGQLKRVFSAEELREVLRELRMIFISHMHADHHLGTVAVIKAWYEEVHDGQPLPSGMSSREAFNTKTGLAVVSEPAMQNWLAEYASVEDYGYSRLAPLFISQAMPHRRLVSRLGWFVTPRELASLSSDQERRDRLAECAVSPESLGLADIAAVAVKHCHGARAVSITFPSSFKVSYSGDCRPSKAFGEIGKGSTVCIHEATFDDELQGDAEAKNHSTTSEALGVAQAMGAKACVLTHFSQRYQKIPVLERNGEPGKAVAEDAPIADNAEEESVISEDLLRGLMDDVAVAFPEQATANEGDRQHGMAKPTVNSTTSLASSGSAAVRLQLASDMKVGVAFDYMRVKVGEIAELEKFTPALLKLFAEEEKPAVEENVEVSSSKKKQGKKQGRDGKK